jgi:hypothetical protein
MTQIKLIGTYRVTVTEAELEFIAKVVHGLENAHEAVSQTVLVEIEVLGADEEFDVGEIQLPWDQVPYDEIYFSLDGTTVIARDFKKPTATDFRVCFYLHDFDAGDTIVSPYGDLETGEITAIPERLAQICVYEHPG